MQVMAEMRQRQDGETRSYDNDRCGSSSDDEVVAASALQLQLQQVEEQPQRLQEPAERDNKTPPLSVTPPESAARRPTCVSGGGIAGQRRMLERDGNSLASDQPAKRGRLSSSADARIHMR